MFSLQESVMLVRLVILPSFVTMVIRSLREMMPDVHVKLDITVLIVRLLVIVVVGNVLMILMM